MGTFTSGSNVNRKRAVMIWLSMLTTCSVIFCQYHISTNEIRSNSDPENQVEVNKAPRQTQSIRINVRNPRNATFGSDHHTTKSSNQTILTKLKDQVGDDRDSFLTSGASRGIVGLRNNLSKEVRNAAAEILEKVPTKFLPDYKNPCWLRNGTELNCLPYFYVIGMYKCGTTDIWSRLTAHPDVLRSVPKEPHWWGPRRLGWIEVPIHGKEVREIRSITGGKDDSSFQWYLNWYKKFAVNQVEEAVTVTATGEKFHPKVFGDASISTSYVMGKEWMKKFPDASGPPYTVADLLHVAQPNAKIIMMIRNPTERLHSWYFYIFVDATPEKFHKLVTRYIECFNNCMKDHQLRYCAYSFGCPFAMLQSLNIGIYHIYLQDWIRAYSRRKIHVIRLEDWYTKPVEEYRRVLNFLELDPLSEEQESQILKRRPVNANSRKQELLNETKTILDDFYRPFNQELADLMNDSRFLYT